MKHFLLLCLLVAGSICARKTKFTIYNKSLETILVSFDTKPRSPLGKSYINPGAAKNFFVEQLQVNRPYALIIESSSDLVPKLFTIRMDSPLGKIILERNHVEVSSMPAAVLRDIDKFIRIVYRGSLKPEIPEIAFVQ